MTPDQSLLRLDLPVAVTDRWIDQLHEPHRHYHRFDHIRAMLGWLEESDASREMIAAIWLHDIIYDPKAPDNEERSAAQARADLSSFDIDALLVADLILGTKHHGPASDQQNILNDLDLSIFGASRVAYQDYAAQIRAEYAYVPVDIYRPNRARILRHFDERQIYQTPRYAMFEERAHDNLRWEIEILEAPGPVAG